MNRKITAAIIGLGAALVLAGCGSSNNTVEKKSLEDYQKVSAAPEMSFSSFKKVNALTDVNALVLEADADPDETTERHTAETTAKIYNKNTTSSAVIGEYEDEDEVLVLEKLTGTNWYKIVYNGRVAYVQATVLEVKSDSEGSYNNYIGYSDDVEDFDESAAHSDDPMPEEASEQDTEDTTAESASVPESSESGSEESSSEEKPEESSEAPESSQESSEENSSGDSGGDDAGADDAGADDAGADDAGADGAGDAGADDAGAGDAGADDAGAADAGAADDAGTD